MDPVTPRTSPVPSRVVRGPRGPLFTPALARSRSSLLRTRLPNPDDRERVLVADFVVARAGRSVPFGFAADSRGAQARNPPGAPAEAKRRRIALERVSAVCGDAFPVPWR